jgi:hypothetical protein
MDGLVVLRIIIIAANAFFWGAVPCKWGWVVRVCASMVTLGIIICLWEIAFGS